MLVGVVEVLVKLGFGLCCRLFLCAAGSSTKRTFLVSCLQGREGVGRPGGAKCEGEHAPTVE